MILEQSKQSGLCIVYEQSCCSDFRRKKSIYAMGGFLFNQFSAIEIINSFQQYFLYPIEDIDYFKSLPTFEEKRVFMLWVIFYLVNFRRSK